MAEPSAHTVDGGSGQAEPADERGTGRTRLTAPMLGFGCGTDDEGQVVVTCVLQGSPAAYSGQVGIGDVIEAIDSRMVSSLQQLSDAASGPVRFRDQHSQPHYARLHADLGIRLTACPTLRLVYRRRTRW
jgi:hypothetical protein